MKLSTRLSLVVASLVTVLSTSIGAFALIDSNNSEMKTYTSLLNKAAVDTLNSHDDPYSFAIALSDASPLPLSVAVATESPKLSYLVENESSISARPTTAEIETSMLKQVLVEKSRMIRSIRTDSHQYLIYSVSISDVQLHSQKLIKHLILFVGSSLLISIFIAYLLFRRDSKVNELARSLQENNRRMQEFLGDASHELRTPLTVIRGYVELLSTDPDHFEAPRYIMTIQSEVKRMDRIISDLLLLAELGEGRVSDQQEINLSEILERRIAELRDLFHERLVSAEISPVTIHGDLGLVENLLGNIFSNIIRHTPSDAPVKAQLSSNKNQLFLMIEDGGPGIADIERRLFLRFDPSRSRESGGSGLGMSVIDRIVKHLGGTLILSRSSLGGLCIEIKLPI